MNSPPFNGYTRLDRTQREIRIVTLKGFTNATNETSQIIRCSLEQVPLDEASPFYALSYVWGSPGDTKPVDLDGQTIQIRDNLWQFLQQLCVRFKGLRVWLDYICINQQDIEERNFQVSIMDQIYRSADSVYAWIGPSTRDSDKFFESVQVMTDLRDKGARHADVLDSYEVLMSDYQDIVDRTYWTRLWIIQEFILARNLWFFCGPVVTNWKDLEYAVNLVAEQLRLARIKQWSIATSIHSLFQSRSRNWTESLSSLVQRFQSSKCHDSRDRIFGLLSLVDQSEAKLVTVDYSKPLLQLLLDTCAVWSQELADDLHEGCSRAKPLETEARLKLRSVSIFCNAFLEMMTLGDLERLQESEEVRRAVTTKCVFTSSTPPRKISKSVILAAVTQDGTLEVDIALASKNQPLGYVSVLRENPASSNWLFAYTNAPVVEGDTFITISDRTLLVLRENETHQAGPAGSVKVSSGSSVVVRGMLIEPLHSSCCTRTLQLPQVQHLLDHLLPDAEYRFVTPNALAVHGREIPGRLQVELNTAALVMLLVTHQKTSHQEAERARNDKLKWRKPSTEGQSSHESTTWSPWDFGLKYHLLQPCLRCKLYGHRVGSLQPSMMYGMEAAAQARCECEWMAKSWC